MVDPLDLPPDDHLTLLTEDEMLENVTTILRQHVELGDAWHIARRAVDILIREGYVSEWGFTEHGVPLFEARFGAAVINIGGEA